MRFVDRATINVPASLSTPSAAVQSEKEAAEKFYRTYDPTLKPKPKAYSFKCYKDFDVKYSLELLFNNKCAYCESAIQDNSDVEHFRPKGSVTEDVSHSGYWWLAHIWDNLLLSCSHCNQTRRQHLITECMTPEELSTLSAKKASTGYGKANHFPVEGPRANHGDDLAQEKPHLIDPTLDDPDQYFRWVKPQGLSIVLANTTDQWTQTRALATIQIFALNRIKLVQSRTKILNELRYQAETILEELEEDMAAGGCPRLIERARKRMGQMRRMQEPDQPYSAMARAFIDEFAKELDQRVKR